MLFRLLNKVSRFIPGVGCRSGQFFPYLTGIASSTNQAPENPSAVWKRFTGAGSSLYTEITEIFSFLNGITVMAGGFRVVRVSRSAAGFRVHACSASWRIREVNTG